MEKVSVTIITGYLGSGKTTLMNELLRKNSDKKMAIVVNDLGSVNIDSELIKNGNIIENKTLLEMTGGCICCTLRAKFMQELQEIAVREDIDSILVEASGVSNPTGICEGFVVYEERFPQLAFYLNNVVTVVDASRIYDEFLDGLRDDSPKDDADIINLIMDQIEFCNLLVLNKCDLLNAEQLSQVKEVIRGLQPEAEIIESVQGKINLDMIFNCTKFDFNKVLSSSTYQKSLDRDASNDAKGMDDFGITSFVYKEVRPFNYNKFMRFINDYPKCLIRSKGYMWFSKHPKLVQLLEQSGKNITITPVSNWVAALSKRERNEMFEYYPEIKENWHEKYGDRLNELVLIGRSYDQRDIINALNNCLDN